MPPSKNSRIYYCHFNIAYLKSGLHGFAVYTLCDTVFEEFVQFELFIPVGTLLTVQSMQLQYCWDYVYSLNCIVWIVYDFFVIQSV